MQQDKSLISVIVPVYNAEKYLSECVYSIINQSYANLEIILVNDGSVDNSLQICEELEKKDKRVKVLDKPNSGVSDTRNVGVANSNGAYISFVDSDDMLKKDALEIMYQELTGSNVDVVFSSYELDYSGKRVQKNTRLPSGIYEVSSLKGKLIDDGTMSGILFGTIWNALYKKNIITKNEIKFDVNVKFNEDGLFNLVYLQYCENIKILNDKYLYVYRQNEQSVTRTVNLKENRFDQATSAISKLFKDDNGLKKEIQARNVSIGLWKIIGICNKDNPKKYSDKIKEIKEVYNDKSVVDGLACIDVNNLNKYKLIYFHLIKNKMIKTTYLLTRYIYPTLTKVISR